MDVYVRLKPQISDSWISHEKRYRVLAISRGANGTMDFLLLIREKQGEWPTIAYYNETTLDLTEFSAPSGWVQNGDLLAPSVWSYEFLERLADRDPDCYLTYMDGLQ